MGYQTSSGRWANTTDLPLIPTGTVITASGNTAAVELGDKNDVRLILAVTAASGTTPSITVTVQMSKDGVTWISTGGYGGAFTAATGVTSESKVFVADRFVRLSYTVTGTTPSFTMGVTGEAV